jgi:20S proteasome alpha/beta subunit
MCLLPGVASSSSAAPWQSNSGTPVLEQETLRDLPPIVFSSAGRLYLVERTVSAASSVEDNSSNLVVALCCREGVVLVTTANTSPHLDITTTVENDDETALWMARKGRHCAPLSTIAPEMFMVTGGNAVDSCILRKKITRIAEAMLEENDGGQPLTPSQVSCAALARRVSDHLQLPTQTMGKAGRLLAVGTVIIFFFIAHNTFCENKR